MLFFILLRKKLNMFGAVRQISIKDILATIPYKLTECFVFNNINSLNIRRDRINPFYQAVDPLFELEWSTI
jgi:hypothetical protein